MYYLLSALYNFQKFTNDTTHKHPFSWGWYNMVFTSPTLTENFLKNSIANFLSLKNHTALTFFFSMGTIQSTIHPWTFNSCEISLKTFKDFVCTVCGFHVHKKCLSNLLLRCSNIQKTRPTESTSPIFGTGLINQLRGIYLLKGSYINHVDSWGRRGLAIL